MGFRSDVFICMKVENFEELKKRLLADEDGKYLVQTISEEHNFEDGTILFGFIDVKWYDSFKEVQIVEDYLTDLSANDVEYKEVIINEDNTIETRENYIEGLCDHMSPYADIDIY